MLRCRRSTTSNPPAGKRSTKASGIGARCFRGSLVSHRAVSIRESKARRLPCVTLPGSRARTKVVYTLDRSAIDTGYRCDKPEAAQRILLTGFIAAVLPPSAHEGMRSSTNCAGIESGDFASHWPWHFVFSSPRTYSRLPRGSRMQEKKELL